jgi:hypothetical protein
MAPAEISFTAADRQQRYWARLAGFLFLWLIFTGLTGAIIESHISGSGGFADSAQRIRMAEHLYRAAICIELIETMSALVLAFALYITLRPANELLAQFGMYWRIGESILGAVGVMFGFLTLRVYTTAEMGAPSAAMADVLGHAGSNVGAIFFSIGSLIFYYVFFKSRYIPRWLSGLGMFASVVVTIICFGSQIFPEHASLLQYGWAPMAVGEVATGIWLMIFAVKTPPAELALR